MDCSGIDLEKEEMIVRLYIWPFLKMNYSCGQVYSHAIILVTFISNKLFIILLYPFFFSLSFSPSPHT